MPLIRSMAFANVLSGSKSGSQSPGIATGVKKEDVTRKVASSAWDLKVHIQCFLSFSLVLLQFYSLVNL